MTGTLKTTLIQNPSSADVNITLGTAGEITLAKSPVLNGSTSGTITIAAPAVAGTNTLTLPAVTDTLVGVAATQTLTGKTLTSPTITGAFLSAGTASVAPLDFAAGTNLTTALAGTLEYDGKVFYGTPQSTQRGVIPGQQFFQVNSSIAGANVATAQSVFGVSVTLSASTVYAFEAAYYMNKTVGATSHTVGFGFGGTATINSIYWNALGIDITTTFPFRAAAQQLVASNSLANIVWSGAIASAAANFVANVKGTISINAAGTFTPQYTLSAAPGGAYSAMPGSYFLIYPIGTSGSNVNVGTWA